VKYSIKMLYLETWWGIKCTLNPLIMDSHQVLYTTTILVGIRGYRLTFWHWSFTFNSNKSPTWCNNFSIYYPDVCLQLNMFRAFSRPSSGAQWLQWQPLVLPLYCGDSRAVFVVGLDNKLKNCCIRFDDLSELYDDARTYKP
jgi:hypothetical protein